VTGNGYDQAPQRIPTNWLDSIRDFEASSVMRSALGDYFVDTYGKIKLGEYRRFAATVPALDVAWYARSV
jgi:glutamine synthetase